jgi:hypothetical protein
MLFGELVAGMLFGELAKVAGDWLWHNDMTDNRPVLGLSCLSRFAVEKAKGTMESIVGRGGLSPLHGVVHLS